MSTNIMQRSPLDVSQPSSGNLIQIKPAEKKEWVPSRYNARAKDQDGSLIVWNTFTGALSVFEPKQVPLIERLLSKQGFSGELKGITEYLYDRGHIVAKGTDEYRRLRVLASKQHYRSDILELFLLSSEDCNFRCTYCYEEFKRGTMFPSVRANIKKLVNKQADKLRSLNIGWFGGEPLYGFEAIEDLAPYFLETAEKNSINYASSMTTNGYLLTPDIAEKLLAWKVTTYQITIDGVAEQHDKNRSARDGSPTFHQIFSNLQAMRKRKDSFSIRIRVNFDRENSPHLHKLLDLCQKEFSDDSRFKLAFHAVGKWGGANDEQLDVCGVDENFSIMEQLTKSASEKGLNMSDHTLKQTSTPGKLVCYAGRPYNFIIGADGKLMKCTIALDTKDFNIVGMLTDDGEIVLNQDRFALWVDPGFEGDPVCQKCYLVPTCQGMGCPLVRLEEHTQPCPSTKHNLRNQLLTTLEAGRKHARHQVVQAPIS